MSEQLQIVGGLIYRLFDGKNCDEINVTMWECSRSDEFRAEGARRVLACVNALAHISTEELETGNMQNLIIRMRDAEQQRDELLEIVKDMRNAKSEVFSMSTEGRNYLAKMNAAIAKAEA